MIAHPMKRLFLKLCSLVMIMSVALSVISCGKTKGNKRDATIISEDSPWFTSNIIDCESGADPDKNIEYLNYYLAGADDKYYVVFARGRYAMPPEDEIDYDNFDYNSFNFGVVSVVDKNTKTVVNTIDLNNGLSTDMLSYEFIDNAVYSDGKITVKTSAKERDYDPLSGEVLDSRPVQRRDNIPITDFYKVGEYVVEVEIIWADNSNYSSYINVKSSDGNMNSIELKELGNQMYVEAVLSIDDIKALVLVRTNKGYRYYELDLTNGKLTQARDKDYKWLDVNKLGQSFLGSDGIVYFRNANGYSTINVATKSTEDVFDYSWCNINRGIISRLELADCTGDSFIFIGQTKPSSIYESAPTSFQIIELTKADKNPNAGKTVLELYTESHDETVGAAVEKFNNENTKYFIEYVDRYSVDLEKAYESVDIASMDEDEYKQFKLELDNKLSNALAMDIMNGEGPDILINTSKYSQLNNPEYLIDLSPYVKGFDPENYFTNIIDGAKIEGALYQLPVSYSINGIYTDIESAGSSGIGFTLEEYPGFVNGPCNGTDLIQSGQAVYFAMLFNDMREKFLVDGKADLSVPEFAQLADYVKDNVPEECQPFEIISEKTYNYADYGNFYGIGSFYSARTGMIKNPTILGIPSLDGHGPNYSLLYSVAVSKQAVDINACGDFVKLLTSDEIQTYMAMKDFFIINRNAFRTAAEKANSYYNNGGSMHSNGGGSSPYNGGKMFSETEVDNVERVIMSCSKMQTEDSAISIILIEEMPAYFLGQKNLDTVINIAENRIQKVLDERG